MTEGELNQEEAKAIMQSLLQKQGNWVEWGKACHQLQKAGYSAKTIFEETGFQGSQQNLVIVAAQVYDSIEKSGASPEVLNYYIGPRSDVLYEIRILNQNQRLETAKLAMEKKLDAEQTKEVAKAVQEASRMSQLPDQFSLHPGDVFAYQCWKRARQKKDLQDRSRLIAQGLQFAHSPSARQAIEKLLSDFTVVPTVKAPLLPLYRLDAEEEIPRIIPVAGNLPLTPQEFTQVQSLSIQEPFGSVQISHATNVVPIPGWQAILKAVDPVGIFASSELLPQTISTKSETVLVVVDRNLTEWNVYTYFLVAENDQLLIRWFETPPSLPILGQIIVILRPKKIIDEGNITQPWQMDD